MPLGDLAMMQYTKTLSQALLADGTARLAQRAVNPKRLRMLSEEAAALVTPDTARTPALEWFMDNARLVEGIMLTFSGRNERLPSVKGVPRIQRLMRELVAHGDAHVSSERLLGALEAFDEVQPLRMAELWAAPKALRIELVSAFLEVSEQVVQGQRDRAFAEEWIAMGAKSDMITSMKHSNTFYEHALMLMHEQEMPKARRMLEGWLERHEAGAGAAIQLAHAEQAMTRLWLSNIMGTLRMLESLDWLACFERLSRTERELRRDPAGVYPRMDEESRAALRCELAALSKAADLSELTVARQAVQCAQRATEEGDVLGGVCWWLYDDRGREALLMALDAQDVKPQKLTPDPNGQSYMAWITLITLAFFALFYEGTTSLLCALCALPLCWGYAAYLINHACARLVKPHPLLKLSFDEVPEELGTLIVIPTLLSSVERAREAFSQLEALGCQQKDEHIDLLLLGDFKDGPNQHEPSDRQILDFACEEVARMNRRAGREKYFYLNRDRAYCRTQSGYMGRERKRGALMALNRLLLDGESAFDAEGARADELHRRGYRYVIPLDAGTWMLPGTAHKLIGAIAHPLNRARQEGERRRGYAVLQPHMEQATPGRLNRFARLMAGLGGVPSYPSCVSEVYQDLCGRGIFGGKGIYDLRAFEQALEGKLPDESILSHDLIEGLMSGAATLCDVALFDSFPETPSGYFSRMNRWIRGDWQLLPFIGRRLGLSRFENYMMIDNLRRSLTPVSTLLLMLLGLWLGNAPALLIGLVYPFAPALLALPRIRKQDWVSCALRLSLLPVECYQSIDAILRTLYRLVSRKNLLSWVTAADAERGKSGQMLKLPGRIVCLLMIPALLRPEWVLLVVGLGALFLTPELQIQDDDKDVHALDDEQRALLKELAQATWTFFERQVPESSFGLPPDNVQLSPPVGAARRTSPTNIGLYLTSCLAAMRLGLIDEPKMIRRMAKTVATLEKLPKWKGQLYNWYDIDTLEPLHPKYVSAVDGGNLAACLMACSAALCELDAPRAGALARRMNALCQDMDFGALFDEQRKLFVIGADVEHERLSASHYDLLASESRILSIVAMALGKAPVKHWGRLGRGLSGGRHGRVLTSWSGTMFEYLMPELFMRAPEHSMLGMTNESVVKAQLRQADGFIWGVSESGYNAFDLQMNYQYRAFGLPQLSMRGDPYEKVIAPYASVLALPIDPGAATENIRRMKQMGLMGEYGLYEAVDCAPERLPEGVRMHVVKSFMAHHQGMILCALLNALDDDYLIKRFMGRPEVCALRLLLCERQPDKAGIGRSRPEPSREQHHKSARRTTRRGNPDAPLPDTHLMYGGGGTRLTSADGRGFLQVRGVMANRWQLGSSTDADGLYVHVRVIGKNQRFVANGPMMAMDKRMSRKVSFEAGSALWTTRSDELELKLIECVSPEDGALVQQIQLTNHDAKPLRLELTGCFAVALSAQADMQAHPVFQNLFVESATAGPDALVFRRRMRDDKCCPLLVHALFGARDGQITRESDLAQLIGRDGSLADAHGIAKKLTGTVGRVLNPCSALRVKLALLPGEKRELGFAIALCENEDKVRQVIKRYQAQDAARRAQMLSQTQARAMLDFLHMNVTTHSLLQRGAAFLSFNKLRFLMDEPPVSYAISGLWALGISGDLPIISAFISSKDHLELAREAMRAHEFYRSMGVWCDLVLVNEYGNNYEQPVRDALRELTGSSHLREMISEPGGVFLLEGATLHPSQRALIRSVSAIALIGGEGSMNAQILRRLNREPQKSEPPKPLPHEDRPLEPIARNNENGWGGFSADGKRYIIDLVPGNPTPAPWCNLISNEGFGTLITERGGGFSWRQNSRSGRLTSFVNDPLREGFTERLYLLEGAKQLSLLPEPGASRARFRVTHSVGMSSFKAESAAFSWCVRVFLDAECPLKCFALSITNRGTQPRQVRLKPEIDWLMGVGVSDARFTRVTVEGSMMFARGAMEGVGFSELSDAELHLAPGENREVELLIGWASDAIEARALISQWREQGGAAAQLERALDAWETRLSAIQIRTPDALMSQMVSRWLPYQSLSARVLGRTGLYQAGGAYGFRDQLQDMLCLIPIDPQMVRRHILLCAAHQFEEGDVMHWWHPDKTGVRTRISDDLLFLPYVTAEYVKETGDAQILSEQVPYLKAEPLKEGEHDCYQTPPTSELSEPLHQHCIRAIRCACRFGTHGLPLMGGGDWNDGMNRVGEHGQGESVWLGEFLSVVADEYAALCSDDAEREELINLRQSMRNAVEQGAWDGQWYRRAYYDDGSPLGSALTAAEDGCRIDAIAQSWAVLAGLDELRARSAMDQVWEQLVDQQHGLIRLLTPPFDNPKHKPGYIMGYPPGVRENGGQYTHGACWVVAAYALLGQAERAWQAFEMLLPYNHSNSAQAAERYRVEPYVVAADVYSEPPHEGRGGWTWYTGAAAWLCRVMTKYLLGYERRGDCAVMHALLPDKWSEASITIRVGESQYTLISRKGVHGVTLDGKPIRGGDILLADDGARHEAVFPARLA